jgi:hypothetical protein
MIFMLIVVTAHAAGAGLDDCTQSMFADLLARAGTRGPEMEAAAFLVSTEQGMKCVLWPHDRRARTQAFRGAIPPGTVAIAHTHPDRADLREPSKVDLLEARRTGLPIYVVTNWTIWLADPDTGRPKEIAFTWKRDIVRTANRACGCK